jgi:starch synthase
MGVAILGVGDPALEHDLYQLSQRFPNQVSFRSVFDERLAHYIYAGSDFFLMPSLFEACGSCQMYSMAYGTLPIVRATGGLDDTVLQYDEATGTGTGFKFWEISGNAIFYTVGWAVSTYYDRPQHMQNMIRQAMQQDYSWEKSALVYLALYERAIEVKPK